MTTESEKRVALITGASSGIGRAAAIRLAGEGIDTILVARSTGDLEATAKRIEAAGSRTVVLPADLMIDGDIERVIAGAGQLNGRLDILVNAAGIIGNGTLDNTTLEAWDAMMQINLRSVFHLIQGTLPLLETARGAIVNVSSVTGTRAFPGILAYCVSKAGVDQLTRCLALELAPRGVRVNAVNPGVVRTHLHRRGGMDEKAYGAFLEHSRTTHPLGRVGEPEEIAELIAFLATERSAWITGTTVNIDGGRAQTCAR